MKEFKQELQSNPNLMPMIALRGPEVVFPKASILLYVGRPMSIDALNAASLTDNRVILVLQQDKFTDEPDINNDIFEEGVLAIIRQKTVLPDGNVKVLFEGEKRVKVKDPFVFTSEESFFCANDYEEIKTVVTLENEALNTIAYNMWGNFSAYAFKNDRIPKDIVEKTKNLDIELMTDILSMHLPMENKHKQFLISESNLEERIRGVSLGILHAIKEDEIDKELKDTLNQALEKNHREYVLNERFKILKKELGRDEEDALDDLDKLEEAISNAKMPQAALEKAQSELKKLRRMRGDIGEASIIRNYIETLIDLPWDKSTTLNKNLEKAQETLEKDHYGLERIKERILEYLAVQNRVDTVKSPILCFVGPPGVGKTSLGQSIAKATGRNYVRMALGGVRDEAEIRGHRRTYLGAMPGQIVKKVIKSDSNNPLFLLDEIDKIGQDHRGDPAAALLEVLDPEQNKAFNDNFLEVDFDLSKIMFVATSNSMNIPPALLDRMEIINLSGYTEDEKMHIAIKHLVPKQLKAHGLKKSEIRMSDAVILDIIRYYTREAGVRSLEREIAKICRKVVRLLAAEHRKSMSITIKNLKEFLGVKRYDFGKMDTQNRIGEVTGLAWTSVGGDLLTIETASMIGKGKLSFTGSLGDVMKESMQAAMVVVRQRSEKLGIATDFYEKRDIHIHVPDGATPKDGPSAGIAITTALVSSLTGNPVRKEVAMTGEISLSGKVLPIGGLKEKLLAAHRGGITTVLIPKENVKDLEEIPQNVKEHLAIYAVSSIDEVLSLALENPPLGVEFNKLKPLGA